MSFSKLKEELHEWDSVGNEWPWGLGYAEEEAEDDTDPRFSTIEGIRWEDLLIGGDSRMGSR